MIFLYKVLCSPAIWVLIQHFKFYFRYQLYTYPCLVLVVKVLITCSLSLPGILFCFSKLVSVKPSLSLSELIEAGRHCPIWKLALSWTSCLVLSLVHLFDLSIFIPCYYNSLGIGILQARLEPSSAGTCLYVFQNQNHNQAGTSHISYSLFFFWNMLQELSIFNNDSQVAKYYPNWLKFYLLQRDLLVYLD